MSDRKKARPIADIGLRLDGREVAAEAQLLVFSFLSLAELHVLRRVSRGWASKAAEALMRLESAAVDRNEDSAGALRWCRRLRVLTAYWPMGPLVPLIQQNRSTLTALEVHCGGGAAVLKAVCSCRSLLSLKYGGLLDGGAVERLAASCPSLESLNAKSPDWDALFSASAWFPRLSSLGGSAPLTADRLPRLVAAFPLLESLEIDFGALDAVPHLAVLSRLPRLSSLSVRWTTEAGGGCSAAVLEQAEDKRPALAALRSLTLTAYGSHNPLAELLLGFSAPSLQQLRLRVGAAAPPSLLMEHFPALTELAVQDPNLSAEAVDADVEAALALVQQQQQPWRHLRTLKLSWLLTGHGERFVPFLARLAEAGVLSALSELEASGGTVSGVELCLLLRAFPRLTSLDLSNISWKGQAAEEETGGAAADASSISSSSTSTAAELCEHGLESLTLRWFNVGAAPLMVLAGAFRFRRLRRLTLDGLGTADEKQQQQAYNVMPRLLLPARETLQELIVRWCSGLCLSFGEAEDRGVVFPRLQNLSVDDRCAIDEDGRRVLGLSPQA